MWEFTPVDQLYVQLLADRPGGSQGYPMFQTADRGDSEPPHFDGPEQVQDGSAATYSATASTFGATTGLVPLSSWPQSTAGAAATVLAVGVGFPNGLSITSGRDNALLLPEHAQLQFQPMVRATEKSYAAPVSPRGGHNRRGAPRRRGS